MKAKFHIALAAVACGFALTTAAHADPAAGEALTKVVSYADLNLNGGPGVQTLYGRLRVAAAEVCAPFRGTSLRERTQWRDCFNPALAHSVADVNEPRLTAYYLTRTGTTEYASRVAKE